MNRVNSFILLIFILLGFFCCPFVGIAQGGLFSTSPNADIIRKAKKYKLVAAKDKIPGIFIDLRYKKTSASGRPLYLNSMPCLIHESTAAKLKAAQKELKKQGYAIKIWDAWRPSEAHYALWNAVRDPKYVVPPSKGLSLHCRGISVDVTLVKIDGTAVKMPSKFDEFNATAASRYIGDDPEIARHVKILQTAMRNAGFRTIRSEWWHFDDLHPRGGSRTVTAKALGIPMP